MSSGPSDAAAENSMVMHLWCSAIDLRNAVKKFAHAAKVARVGHRGYSVPRRYIVDEINELIKELGFEVVDRDPQRTWESYPDV